MRLYVAKARSALKSGSASTLGTALMLGALALTFTPVFWQQWPQWESSGRPSCAICTRSLWPSSSIPRKGVHGDVALVEVDEGKVTGF